MPAMRCRGTRHPPLPITSRPKRQPAASMYWVNNVPLSLGVWGGGLVSFGVMGKRALRLGFGPW